jgi:xylulokinase
MEYLLGVDTGTSGTKTALFTPDGNLIAAKTVEYPLRQNVRLPYLYFKFP